ncbi:hypothetical protein N0V94_004103 [Neodidymelliopsis sp. IMI 364377]|nr:hypothetical protein N0V94_004103 [Neodidymelliopsis sp. IMI 364377]
MSPSDNAALEVPRSLSLPGALPQPPVRPRARSKPSQGDGTSANPYSFVSDNDDNDHTPEASSWHKKRLKRTKQTTRTIVEDVDSLDDKSLADCFTEQSPQCSTPTKTKDSIQVFDDVAVCKEQGRSSSPVSTLSSRPYVYGTRMNLMSVLNEARNDPYSPSQLPGIAAAKRKRPLQASCVKIDDVLSNYQARIPRLTATLSPCLSPATLRANDFSSSYISSPTCQTGQMQTALIGRTARLTPASDIIDLTKNDCDAVLSNMLRVSNPGAQDSPLGRSPFTDVTEEESESRLQILARQRELATQDELVCHLDQDLGAGTPKLQPRTGANHASPVQQLIQDLYRADTLQHVSPLGKIGEKRYREFDMKFYSALNLEKTLFKGGAEMLENCVEVLNEWMLEGKEFTLKEIRAAFEYLETQWRLKIEGDVVHLDSTMQTHGSNTRSYACGGSVLIKEVTNAHEESIASPVTIRWDSSDGVEKLQLPLSTDSTASNEPLLKLITATQPASFGYNGEDIIDESYRKATKLEPSAFSVDFCPYAVGIIDTIGQTLLPLPNRNFQGIRAELYKLNVYEVYKQVHAALANPLFFPDGGVLGKYCSHAYAHATNEGIRKLPAVLKGSDMVTYEIFQSLGIQVQVRPALDYRGHWRTQDIEDDFS